VLRGHLSLATTELFNPPLGVYGWPSFEVGGQYLIAASASDPGTPGQVVTSLCAPNEQITARARFDELIALSEAPILADTALPVRSNDASTGGWILIVVAALLALSIRRSHTMVGET
jgi:hypothetical protein